MTIRALRLSRFALTAALALLIAGCSGPTHGDESATPEPTGPWAAEISASYNDATTDFSRAVLADGTVSEQEFSEMLQSFQRCLSEAGVTMTSEYRLDGSFDTGFAPGMTADQANSITEKCSRSAGENVVGSIYSWTHRNPEHADEDAIVAACLVRSGLVPAGYSATDYRANTSDDRFPFADERVGRRTLDACRLDPLELRNPADGATTR